jgi:Predicted membrane protein (DUF2079)
VSLPWRTRLDYRLLKLQARFEGLAFDRAAPWLFGVAFWLALTLLALARSRELSQDSGLASMMQTVWLIGDGYKPDATLLGGNFLAEQGGFLVYPIAGLASLFPTATTLLALQAGALASGLVPLWRLARNVAHLRIGTTLAISVAYSVYSAVHALNVAGFRTESLALPALIAAVYFGYTERWIRYALAIAVVMTARADLGLAVAGMGGLWFFEGRRRLGLVTGAVGMLWAAVMILVIQPRYGGGDFPYVQAFSDYGGDNPFSVLWGVISRPVSFAQELFSEANFSAIVHLLAPVLFLPVVAPRHLMPAVPLYCLYLVADVPPGELVESGQAVPITAFVFVALIFALAKTGRVVVQLVNVDKRFVVALLLTSSVFFVADSVTSPYAEPWSWGRRDLVDSARLEAAEMIPDDAVVRAAPTLLPLLTERVGLFELDAPPIYDSNVGPTVIEGSNWIVFDRTAVPGWSSLNMLDFRTAILVTARFEQVYGDRDSEIQVFALPSEVERLGLQPVS